MISTRTILRRTLHTTSRLRSQKPFEKGGDEVGSSTTVGAKTYGKLMLKTCSILLLDAHGVFFYSVVSEAVENEKPFGVPSGVYSSGEPHKADASKVSSCESSHSIYISLMLISTYQPYPTRPPQPRPPTQRRPNKPSPENLPIAIRGRVKSRARWGAMRLLSIAGNKFCFGIKALLYYRTVNAQCQCVLVCLGIIVT
jgi:hypothetical protein